MSVRFRTSEAGIPAFTLQGRVVRVLPDSEGRIGVNVRRTENSPETLDAYRKLVLQCLYQTRPEQMAEPESR